MNVNTALFGIDLYKNCFILAKIFVLRLFKMESNQTDNSRLEQRYVIKFMVAETANHTKFTEECVISALKHVLVKKGL